MVSVSGFLSRLGLLEEVRYHIRPLVLRLIINEPFLDGSLGNGTLAKRYGTEVVTCYNIGTKVTNVFSVLPRAQRLLQYQVDRAPSISVIDDWCK